MSMMATFSVSFRVEAANRPSGETAMRPAPWPPVSIVATTSSTEVSITVTVPS